MAYSKTQWVNNQEPSITAENLNKMEQGIADAQFPDGGSTGQILSKTDDGTGWVDAPTSAQWGSITGQLSEQTDLYSELDTLNSNLSQKVSSVNGIQPDTNGNVSLNAEDIPAEGVGTKETIGNPIIVTDAVAENAQNLSVDIEPIQDLHGYDHPWAGGAGKNKLPVLYSSTTKNGVTFTVDSDGTVTATGTATADAEFSIVGRADNVAFPLGSYILSGLPSQGSATTFRWNVVLYNSDDSIIFDQRSGSSPWNITLSENAKTSIFRIRIVSGYTANNLVFKPMLRLASETDATFEPYSNICPITGRTQVDVNRTGKNLAPMMQNATSRGITVTVGADGVVTANGTNTRETAGTIGQSEFVLLKAGSYIVSGSTAANTGVTVQVVKDVGGTAASVARDSTGEGSGFTLTEDALVAVRGYISADANVSNLKLYPMIRPASISDSSYEPYNGQSVTVNLGQTVYGGMLNVTTGELTVKTANIASYNGESIGEPWWSSIDEYVEGATPTTGAQVVYTLATPTTVSLTPAQLALLEGYNILTTDGDNINLRYTGTVASNVQSEIDEFEESTRKLASSLAMIETSPSTANHATGSYLMLKNRLCKVTSPIATGEQIIVGSNVQYTTVAEELTAILAQINA
jgi:hypothetical protein